MNLPARAEYALRAVIFLANDPGQRMKGDVIAHRTGVPLSFLTEILGELRRAGVVGSRSGRDGGYWLKDDPAHVSLAKVIESVDGAPLLIGGRDPRLSPTTEEDFGLSDLWDALGLMLRGISIADLDRVNLRIRLIETLDPPMDETTHPMGKVGS